MDKEKDYIKIKIEKDLGFIDYIFKSQNYIKKNN